MKKLLELSKELERRNLLSEKFILSYCIAKIAAEQLELFSPESYKYKCIICKNVFSTESLEFLDSNDLRFSYSGISPTFQDINPVCKGCVDGPLSVVPCSYCEDLINTGDVRIIDNKTLIRSGIKPKFTEESPLCSDCEGDLLYTVVCALCDERIDFDDVNEVSLDIIYSADKERELNYRLPEDSTYPICNDCFEDELVFNCDDCGQQTVISSEDDFYNGAERRICEVCNRDYITCCKCDGKININNDEYKVFQDEYYCEYCSPENINDNYRIHKDIDSIVRTNNIFTYENYVPVSNQVVSVIADRINNIVKKFSEREFPPDKISADLKSFIEKTGSISKEEKTVLICFLFDNDRVKIEKAKEIAKSYEEYKIKDEEFKRQYAPVKGLKVIKSLNFADVVFDVEEPRSDNLYLSFVVIMSPSKRMKDLAYNLFGKAGMASWEILSARGTIHHSGSIAYARISNHGGEWIIDNLQRDSDLYNFKKVCENNPKTSTLNSIAREYEYDNNDIQSFLEDIQPAIKWWDKQLKSWGPQMLLALQALARKSGVRLYMTPFELQEEKWSRIPEGNKDIYDRIPYELGKMNEEAQKNLPEDERNVFPRMEDVDGETEESDEYTLAYNRLWRIANRKNKLKIAFGYKG